MLSLVPLITCELGTLAGISAVSRWLGPVEMVGVDHLLKLKQQRQRTPVEQHTNNPNSLDNPNDSEGSGNWNDSAGSVLVSGPVLSPYRLGQRLLFVGMSIRVICMYIYITCI